MTDQTKRRQAQAARVRRLVELAATLGAGEHFPITRLTTLSGSARTRATPMPSSFISQVSLGIA
jgi:hypothetical protein